MNTVVENNIRRIESAMENSSLPEEPDYEWIDNLICRVYKDEVINFV